MRRYAALGTHEGHADVVNAAIKEARIWARREAAVGRKTLDAKSIESIFQLDAQSQAIAGGARVWHPPHLSGGYWQKYLRDMAWQPGRGTRNPRRAR